MSFFITQQQIRTQSKTVTRRAGWGKLKPGDLIRAVVKSQGLKRGESPETLGVLEIVSVRREPLDAITKEECALEGFPELSPEEFVAMFCANMQHQPDWPINRIEFKYL